MRISTAGRYALRAMLDLALNGQAGPVLRGEIADRQAISGDYIAQLFRQLGRAGLVRSVMGPGGGYLLARPAENIPVSEILQAVEGPFAAVLCVQQSSDTPAGDERQPVCGRIDRCAAHVLWTNLTRVIVDYLDSVSLQDLSALAQRFEEAQTAGGCTSAAVDALLKPVPEIDYCAIDYEI